MKNECNKCATNNAIWAKRIIYNKPSSGEMERSIKALHVPHVPQRGATLGHTWAWAYRTVGILLIFAATNETWPPWPTRSLMSRRRTQCGLFSIFISFLPQLIAWKREKSCKYLQQAATTSQIYLYLHNYISICSYIYIDLYIHSIFIY